MNHKIDLYDVYQKSQTKSLTIDFKTGFGLYILMLISLVGGIYSLQHKQINQLDSIKAHYLNETLNPSHIESHDAVKALQQQLNEQLHYETQLTHVNGILKDKRKIYSYVISAIEQAQPRQVEVQSIMINRQHVELIFSSHTSEGPSILARNLRRNASFSEVVYNGYQRQAGTKEFGTNSDNGNDIVSVTADTYSGTIHLVLAGGF